MTSAPVHRLGGASLGEGGRVALEVFAQLAQVTDVFFFGGRAKVFELDKRGELCDGGISNHAAASVPVDAESCSPPDQKKLTPTRSDEHERPVGRPPGPPHSGWVQPCAAANPAIASLLQSWRPVGRVAELGSLACITRHDKA